MKSDLIKKCELQAHVFKALSHPTRLLIANELAKGKKCVDELDRLNLTDMTTLSRHLHILKNAGIVTSEKEGRRVYYSLNMADFANISDKVSRFLERDLQRHWGKG